jgi:hypothetical protein
VPAEVPPKEQPDENGKKEGIEKKKIIAFRTNLTLYI